MFVQEDPHLRPLELLPAELLGLGSGGEHQPQNYGKDDQDTEKLHILVPPSL
jgi:hypothetical protein